MNRIQHSDRVIQIPGFVFPGLVIVEAGFVIEAFLAQLTGVEEWGVEMFGLHVIPDTGSCEVGE